MIAGALKGFKGVEANTYVSTIFKVGASLDPDLTHGEELAKTTRLWDLESLGIMDGEVAVDDTLAFDRFVDTIYYDNGQYWVKLPLKENRSCLPDNKGPALSQLRGLMTRLHKEPALLECYASAIQQLIELNFVERVTNTEAGKEVHYLPHHGVKKDSISTPLRVVFNASSKAQKGFSLNDCLLRGPNLTEKLESSLLKFRAGRYGFTADISKAFLRVGLQEEDRDFTRFVWKADPYDINSPIVTYRFKAVLFGATCSPFLLQATLAHHFKACDSDIAGLLAKSFYVDNLIGAVNCDQTLLEIYPEANRVLAAANMPLHQWASNSLALRTRVNEEEEEKMLEEIGVLGINWDTVSDKLNIKGPKWGPLPATK
ncbi:MAG: reverse transcriptase domain-containing protein, partial [Bacteroidota bacterium]